MSPNFYSSLHVAVNAHPEVIKAAYRALCKIHHPDLNPGEESVASMQEINVAYETLSDPERRKNYDDSLEEDQDCNPWESEDDDSPEDELSDEEWNAREEALRQRAYDYIAETMNLNAWQKNALRELTDDELVDIMESFDEKPKGMQLSYLAAFTWGLLLVLVILKFVR